METQPPVQPISKVTEQYRQKGKGQNTEREQNGNAHGKLEKFYSRRSTLGRLLFVCSHCLCPELSTAFKCNHIQVFLHIDIVLFLFCFAKLLANINSCIVKVNLFVVVDICIYYIEPLVVVASNGKVWGLLMTLKGHFTCQHKLFFAKLN